MMYRVMINYPHKNRRYPIYLWEWRKERGLTLVQLAEQTGIAHGILSALETGSRRANLDHLFAVAKTLNISVPQLFRSPADPLNKIDAAANKLTELQKHQSLKVLDALVEAYEN